MRAETLKALHASHMGMSKTKQRARDIFGDGMSKQIEEITKKCSVCLEHQNKSPKEPMITQPFSNLPWNKVRTDLFEVNGNSCLIMVDYYSNFIEVARLQDTTTRTVLRHISKHSKVWNHGDANK